MKEWIKAIKKLSRIRKVFLLLLLFILAAGCSWFTFVVSAAQYTEANRQTVDAVMQDLAHEDYEFAYRKFADKYKQEESFETFEKVIAQNKDSYKDYEPNSFDVKHTTRHLLPMDTQSLEYRGTISFKDGSKVEITAVFIWENDGWKLYLVE